MERINVNISPISEEDISVVHSMKLLEEEQLQQIKKTNRLKLQEEKRKAILSRKRDQEKVYRYESKINKKRKENQKKKKKIKLNSN